MYVIISVGIGIDKYQKHILILFFEKKKGCVCVCPSGQRR